MDMEIRNEREARQRARRIVRKMLAETGLSEAPPYVGTSHPITKELKIKVREAAHPLSDGDGYYTDLPEPTIVLDPAVRSAERRNFTFYHEVGHHLLRNDDLLYSFLDEYGGHNFDQAKEYYCNLIAAEFLMPLEQVMAHLNIRGFSVVQIQALDEKFRASTPALAIQLAQAATHKCIIVLCEYDTLPPKHAPQLIDSASDNECLHIRYTSRSPQSKYSCSRYMPIPRNHIIQSAFAARKTAKGRDQTIFRSGNNFPVHVEAFYYKGRVFAEFRFSEPQNPNQPSLFNLNAVNQK